VRGLSVRRVESPDPEPYWLKALTYLKTSPEATRRALCEELDKIESRLLGDAMLALERRQVWLAHDITGQLTELSRLLDILCRRK
jgi:hypothetical protein